MPYHFVRERALFGEVELIHVLTDRQTVIFTKPLGLDKLRQFSGALGLQHLDVPKLRGRMQEERREEEARPESDEEFYSGRLKKPRTDTTATIEGKSPNQRQLKKREIKPRREEGQDQDMV